MSDKEEKLLEKMPPDFVTAVRTLTIGGFVLQGADRKPGYSLLYVYRTDEFGSRQQYCFALAEKILTKEQAEGAAIGAANYKANLVIVGESDAQFPKLSWDTFINIFGGPIFSTSVLDPDFGEKLKILGHDQLPPDLVGNPDDLFEIYVNLALGFILGGRVVRYGQARRFEPKPDGLAIPGLNFSALYDAKAYKDGYEVTANSIRQFKSYVEDFQNRYQAYYRLNSFIVISGHFAHKTSTLIERSQELTAECGIPLSFLDANSLSQIVMLFCQHPLARRSVNWRRVFTKVVVKLELIEEELQMINKDGVIKN